MKKLCFVATMPEVVHAFLKGHIRACAEKWQVTIVTHPQNAALLSDLDARFIPLEIERKPSPWRDLLALMRLVTLFRRERFDLVYSIGPKTGLLAMPASCLAGVPNRMHIFTGQGWVNKHGWTRKVFKMADRLLALCATQILVDSPSQRDFLVVEGVLRQGEGLVIGRGSVCGVDVHRFHPDMRLRAAVRTELGMSPEQTAILYLGRLHRDKGVLDLAAAFADLASRRSDVVLVLVGAEEDVTFAQVQQICAAHPERLRSVSFTPNPERYMAAADIFCLPSYREGFGQVIVEAAACGLPTVATRIYGITDAVEDGQTGLLFPLGDVAGLTDALATLIADRALRQNMGEAGRMRVMELFASEKITAELVALFEKVMAKS